MRLESWIGLAVVIGLTLGAIAAIRVLRLPQHGRVSAAEARAAHEAAQKKGRDLGLPGFVDRSHLFRE